MGAGVLQALPKPDPFLKQKGLDFDTVTWYKLLNQALFKSVHLKTLLNGTMDSLAVWVFQGKDKETTPISK